MMRADDRADNTARRPGWYITRDTRYAVVVLFALTVAFGTVNLLFTTHDVNANNHKFCQVIEGFVATPVTKPVNPQSKPAQETAYMWYLRFLGLDHSLGC
jgi:hypothetical protein